MRPRPAIIALLVCCAPAAALAQAAQPARPFAAPQEAPGPVPTGIGELGEVTLALAIVLGAVFAVAWLVRRLRTAARPGSAAVDVLADLPLGPRERAVLIRVGTTQLLIGVAPGRVNTLHVLAEPWSPASPETGAADGTAAGTPSPPRPSFRALLMRSLGRP